MDAGHWCASWEMSCFSCFKAGAAGEGEGEGEGEEEEDKDVKAAAAASWSLLSSSKSKRLGSRRSSSLGRSTWTRNNALQSAVGGAASSNMQTSARAFTYGELASATANFRADCVLGEGGLGRVYRGRLEDGQVVAVKQLELKGGVQVQRDFVVEVMTLSQLHHDNLVTLLGYCAEGELRLLVYEYMALGSLADLLLQQHGGLSWETRMRIAVGAARGLEYLHDAAVIYRDLKSSNVLLDDALCPKLSDLGLAPVVSPRLLGTLGYCAPEYLRTSLLTLKSDVFSFGVLLLELITGRRAVDSARPPAEQLLVSWARPMFNDSKRYRELADPLLLADFPDTDLNQAVAVAAMCLQDQPSARPCMSDAAVALSFLADAAAKAARSTTT